MSKMNDNEYKLFWDTKYKSKEFSYGKNPNVFFEEWLQQFPPTSILMPADGEGRNGVFAAQKGWNVTAFDLSHEGRLKAMSLAQERKVKIDYRIGGLEDFDFDPNSFNAIGLIYAHFSADKKTAYHKTLSSLLRPGGSIIFEAFSKKHHATQNGGPKDFDMLYSKEEVLKDFKNYDFIYLEEEEIALNAGNSHKGMGSVIRFVARKIK